MSSDPLAGPVRCWECEAPTADPQTVVLRAPAVLVGTLRLCPGCYAACYLPLAQHPMDSDAPMGAPLVVDVDRAGLSDPC